MNFFKVAGRDISSIFKNRFIRVSVVAIIIVPLLYSLLYLYAFWDPYNRLQDLSVAVVNTDKGTEKDGEAVNYGKDLVDKLKDNDKVGWKFVSKEEAERGLKDKGGYYAIFVVPEDFSAKVISAKDGKPQQPSILYSANEKKNFLAAQINKNVLAELKAELTKNIVDEYTKVTFDSLYEVKDGMQKAADGSKELYDGMGRLKDKVPELKDGVNKLADGSGDLKDGLTTAKEGTVQLYYGANELDSALAKAKDGASQLNEGLGQLNGQVPELKAGISQLYKGSSDLNAGLNQVGAGLNQLNNAVNTGDAQHPSLVQGITSINSGVTRISSTVDALNKLVLLYNNAPTQQQKDYALSQIIAIIPQLNAAVNTDSQTNISLKTGTAMLYNKVVEPKTGLADGVKALNAAVNVGSKNQKSVVAGVGQMTEGLNALNSKIPTLEAGVGKLYAGSSDLSNGLVQIKDGSSKLKNAIAKPEEVKNIAQKQTSSKDTLLGGMTKLQDGGVQLNDGLNTLKSNIPQLEDGVNKLSDGSQELSDKLQEGYDKINKNLLNDSKTMGDFVSQPLTIDEKPMYAVKNYGSGFTPYFIPLSLWVGALMMFFVIKEDVDSDINASSASVVLGKFLSYGIIGIIQAVLASSIVLVLGLTPDNVVLYFLFNILLSFVFIAIIQSLIFLMGDAGRLLAIVLLILQLTACAGTFPLEVVPTFFKVINPLMPFTYAVSGLREVISGLDYNVFAKDSATLAAIMAAFLVFSVLMKGHADRVKERIRQRKNEITA